MSDPNGLPQILEAATLRALRHLTLDRRLTEELPEELRGLAPKQQEDRLSPLASQIAYDLIAEALANGLLGKPTIERIEHSYPTAGSTAEVVSFPEASITFAYKLSVEPKLAAEAKMLRSIREREELPIGFRESFPRVYAVRTDEPPYAYLMERFPFPSLEKLLFRTTVSPKDLETILAEIVGALLSAYSATKDTMVTPNLEDIYLGRITERLADASELDTLFEDLSTAKLTINGKEYRPLVEYLAEVSQRLPNMGCQFSTFAHGDPHPENILIDFEPGLEDVEVKFIDVKAWWKSDYIFDIGKLCHYMLVTGAVEKREAPISVDIGKNDPGWTVSYELQPGEVVRDLHKQVVERVAAFAAAQEDSNWLQRYHLSMAANLLGLPPGRLRKDMRNAAVVYYCEGVRYLEKSIAPQSPGS